MKIIRIPIFFSLAVFLVSNIAIGRENNDEKIRENYDKVEYKALVKCAKIKLTTFKFQVKQIKDVNFLKKQLEDLQNKRLEISRAVRRLENLAKKREMEKAKLNEEEDSH